MSKLFRLILMTYQNPNNKRQVFDKYM